MTRNILKRTAGRAGVLCLIGLIGLAGCRESEENRAIKLEKGGYAGPEDTALSEEQLRALRARGNQQKN